MIKKIVDYINDNKLMEEVDKDLKTQTCDIFTKSIFFE